MSPGAHGSSSCNSAPGGSLAPPVLMLVMTSDFTCSTFCLALRYPQYISPPTAPAINRTMMKMMASILPQPPPVVCWAAVLGEELAGGAVRAPQLAQNCAPSFHGFPQALEWTTGGSSFFIPLGSGGELKGR